MLVASDSKTLLFRKIIATPPLILPLALTTVNLGVAWSVAAKSGAAIGLPPEAAMVTARLLDACGSVAVIFVLVALLRVALLTWSVFRTEFIKANAAYAAGLMTMWSFAGWFLELRMPGLSSLLWTIVLVLFSLSQFLFVRHVLSLLRAAPPDQGCLTTIWTNMEPVWIVSLVGVTAASASGSAVVAWFVAALSWPSAARDVLRFTPVGIGAFWAALIVPPLWAKAIKTRTLCKAPPYAILAASVGIVLAGWLGATSSVDAANATAAPPSSSLSPSSVGENAVSHALAMLVVLSSLPILCLAPTYLHPLKPFDPKIATVGFPLEICAIGMLKYAALTYSLAGGGEGGSPPLNAHAYAAIGAAWLLLIACTLAACVILARFTMAFVRSLGASATSVSEASGGTGSGPGPSGAPRQVQDPSAVSVTPSAVVLSKPLV